MRTAFVTGATRGIGRGIALELAAQGFALTVTSRKPDALADLEDELRAAGSPAVRWHAADLGDRDAVAAAVDVHRLAFKTMDALVLSGGVGTAGPLEQLPDRRVDRVFAVNVAASIALVQGALPMLRATAAEHPARGAKVIAMASITGTYAEPGLAAYGASKAALISLMETLNAEESAHGVAATAIAPGYVHTDMSEWVSDVIPPASMIQVADVVAVVRMVLELGSTASITKIIMSRSGTSGYIA